MPSFRAQNQQQAPNSANISHMTRREIRTFIRIRDPSLKVSLLYKALQFTSVTRYCTSDSLVIVHSFIHSDHFYSASSSPLLLKGAPDTARIPVLCWSFTPKRHRQLRVKGLLKVPTWRLERESNPRIPLFAGSVSVRF